MDRKEQDTLRVFLKNWSSQASKLNGSVTFGGVSVFFKGLCMPSDWLFPQRLVLSGMDGTRLELPVEEATC